MQIDTLDFVTHYWLLDFKIAILDFLTTNGLISFWRFFQWLARVTGISLPCLILFYVFTDLLAIQFLHLWNPNFIVHFTVRKKCTSLQNDSDCHLLELPPCPSLCHVCHSLSTPRNNSGSRIPFSFHVRTGETAAPKVQDILPLKPCLWEKDLDYPRSWRTYPAHWFFGFSHTWAPSSSQPPFSIPQRQWGGAQTELPDHGLQAPQHPDQGRTINVDFHMHMRYKDRVPSMPVLPRPVWTHRCTCLSLVGFISMLVQCLHQSKFLINICSCC